MILKSEPARIVIHEPGVSNVTHSRVVTNMHASVALSFHCRKRRQCYD